MRVYLDVCCLCRPFDDQVQDRIRMEAEAVITILGRFESKEWSWVASEAVNIEIALDPDLDRRSRVGLMLSDVRFWHRIGEREERRAEGLIKMGFCAMDALHLACSERSRSKVFLTTDDLLLKRAESLHGRLKVSVRNPLDWLQEVM